MLGLAAAGIVALGTLINRATEQLARALGPDASGLLNATFNNAAELILSLAALRAGLYEVVKGALAGSILGNLLLVTGLAMISGGARHGRQRFDREVVRAHAGLLVLGVLGLALPSVAHLTAPRLSTAVLQLLSAFAAGALLVAYGASLFEVLRLDGRSGGKGGKGRPRPARPREPGRHPWPAWQAGVVLLGATALTAILAELFVDRLEPVVEDLGLPRLFVGVVFLPLVSNTPEYLGAITQALEDRMELTLSMLVGGAVQVVFLVAPLLVLAGFLLHRSLTLVFPAFILVAVALSVFLLNRLSLDAQSTWVEGVQLVAAYLILATTLFFL